MPDKMPRMKRGAVDKTLEPFWRKLEPAIKHFTKGDDIPDEYILATSGVPPHRLAGLTSRMKRWFNRQGVVVSHRGDYWHLLDDEEQAERPRKRMREGRRRLGFGRYEGATVQAHLLDDAKRGELTHDMRLLHQAYRATRDAERRMLEGPDLSDNILPPPGGGAADGETDDD